jgi:hypothetical protein
MEISPEAIGLFFVLETLLSKSRSKISLIMQPAPRMTIDPIRKIIIKKIFFLKFSYVSVAAKIPQAQGKKSKYMPIGLSSLINKNKFF